MNNAAPAHTSEPADPDLPFDTSVPHPARVYGYWIGGKDHFDADRKAAEDVMRLRPQVVASARANRAFLARVVRYLAAEAGIRQFVDIGVGLPAPDATHQVAQQIEPACRIVYADNDALVLTHARALLTSAPQGTCAYINADLRDPGTIVAQGAQTLDFTQPAAILLLAVLHFIEDAARPAEIVAALASVLAPGSFVAISHVTGDFAPEQVAAATAAYNAQVSVPVTPRTHAQVTALFGGLPLVAPGVVPVAAARPHRLTCMPGWPAFLGGTGDRPQQRPRAGAAVTGEWAAEPTLADVQREYTAWVCTRGVSGFFYAEHAATGAQVNGEDPLDLRDQIKAAQARLDCGLPVRGPSGSGLVGL